MVNRRAFGRDLLHRWEGNPVLTIEDIPFRANTVFNGTPIVTDKGILLLFRVEGQQGYSFFVLAQSEDGFHFLVDKKPVMLPATKGPFAFYEKKGIEDPRATILDNTCYIMYTAVGDYGTRISLAKTDDYINYKRIALVSGPGNKDGVLFPKRINGRYARLDRPIGNGQGSIWISYSPDLINWGDSEVVLSPRTGYWDEFRIGPSIPPIETDQGWLEIYHGVKMLTSGPVYRIGAVLLDLKDPSQVVKRGVNAILSPREDYERIGDVPNVCFASGAVINAQGNINIYYGAADTYICVASCTMKELFEEGF